MRIEDVLQRLDGVRKSSQDGAWMARCPAHDDKDPSLSIKDNGDKILMHCHASCSLENITAAIGARVSDLFSESNPEHMPVYQGLPSRRKLEGIVVRDMTILMLSLGKRVNDRKAGIPDWWNVPFPDEWAEKEIKAAHDVILGLEFLYGAPIRHK